LKNRWFSGRFCIGGVLDDWLVVDQLLVYLKLLNGVFISEIGGSGYCFLTTIGF
jgi:hypothetical protein